MVPKFLDVKVVASADRIFRKRTDRIKAVDLHPSEPWMIASLYSGQVNIFNFKEQAVVKSCEVSKEPVRACKFIPRKQWFITGADDRFVRVYNYNTMEKVREFQAHDDYIRSIAVHPTLPLVLTCSDDVTIRMWDWEKNWQLVRSFEGHEHFVMMLTFSPKDPSTFASASLDGTIKVWGITSSSCHFTLVGHEKSVNCVEYYHGGDKPYLISGSDDRTVRIWDLQSRKCLKVLSGHTNNVSCVAFHPSLPLILTGAEDGMLRVWHSTTYQLETAIPQHMDRLWCMAYDNTSLRLALGYDFGCVMLKLGSSDPVLDMDSRSGKLIWAKNSELQQVNMKASLDQTMPQDGERLLLVSKELPTSEVYPVTISFDPTGRSVVVCGESKFVVFTAIAWRHKSYGAADEYVWGSDKFSASRLGSAVTVYDNLQQLRSFSVDFTVESMFGGPLLALRGSGGGSGSEFVSFYDWGTGALVTQVWDVPAKKVIWNASGDLVAVVAEGTIFILRFNRDMVHEAMESGTLTEEGLDEAFEVLTDVSDHAHGGQWFQDTFIYSTKSQRINYLVGDKVFTLSHLDRAMFVAGYMPKEGRVFLVDKERNITSFELPSKLLEFMSCVLRGDMGAAEEIFPRLPESLHTHVARFLHQAGHSERALEISPDADHRFELALELDRLELAISIVEEMRGEERKWRMLGDAALQAGKISLAERCLRNGKDTSGLLFIYSCTGNASGVSELADMALETGKFNVAFECFFLTRQLDKCLDVLLSREMFAEAAFFARSYVPSRVPEVVSLWRKQFGESHPRIAEAIADPKEYPNLFKDYQESLLAEEKVGPNLSQPLPAAAYLKLKDSLATTMVDVMRVSLPSEASGEQTQEAGGFDRAVEAAQVPVEQQRQGVEEGEGKAGVEEGEGKAEDPVAPPPPPPPPSALASDTAAVVEKKQEEKEKEKEEKEEEEKEKEEKEEKEEAGGAAGPAAASEVEKEQEEEERVDVQEAAKGVDVPQEEKDAVLAPSLSNELGDWGDEEWDEEPVPAQKPSLVDASKKRD